jgi:hypothetical protein
MDYLFHVQHPERWLAKTSCLRATRTTTLHFAGENFVESFIPIHTLFIRGERFSVKNLNKYTFQVRKA